MLSFGGYVVLFRTVFVKRPHPHSHLSGSNWRVSYEITMAGLAATRLFAAAGAGGIALTAWALRRSGMEPRLVACRLVAFNVILYTVYAGSMLIDGLGLGHRACSPAAARSRSRSCPAIVAAVLFSAAAGIARCCRATSSGGFGAPRGGRRAAVALATRARRPCPRSSRAACAPRSTSCRAKDWGVLGALAWWGFDISVLWAMFHAFGEPPPFTVIWMAYFVGTLGNLLPLPGGIGGVEGGMIGALRRVRRQPRTRDARRALLPRDLVLAADDPGRDRLLPAAPHGGALARGGRADALQTAGEAAAAVCAQDAEAVVSA